MLIIRIFTLQRLIINSTEFLLRKFRAIPNISGLPVEITNRESICVKMVEGQIKREDCVVNLDETVAMTGPGKLTGQGLLKHTF